MNVEAVVGTLKSKERPLSACILLPIILSFERLGFSTGKMIRLEERLRKFSVPSASA